MRRFLAVCLVCASVALSAQVRPPAGYRLPAESDLTGGWQEYASRGAKPFFAEGDFDGDRARDEVWLMPRATGEGFGLFAFLNTLSPNPRVLEALLAGTLTDYELRAKYQNIDRSDVVEVVWENLEHYLADADIRAKDDQYRLMQDSEMVKLITLLRTGGSLRDLARIDFLRRS